MASVARSVELKSAEYLTELPTPTAVRLWPTCLDAGSAVVNKQQGKKGEKEEGEKIIIFVYRTHQLCC